MNGRTALRTKGNTRIDFHKQGRGIDFVGRELLCGAIREANHTKCLEDRRVLVMGARKVRSKSGHPEEHSVDPLDHIAGDRDAGVPENRTVFQDWPDKGTVGGVWGEKGGGNRRRYG
ncbi:Hypothetical protein CINCED_3A017620 [Cinara cedri]|uniref:Uncharacterized protein n=1 Tax=Cinara cedri TaxID=506608 RepID=A0A5E4NCU6_9HEMI|nr:Hypothetical protein CINCED_3A017620 [Cinara cedri]